MAGKLKHQGLTGGTSSILTLYVTALWSWLGGFKLKMELVVLLAFVLYSLLLAKTMAGILKHKGGSSVTSSIITFLLSML